MFVQRDESDIGSDEVFFHRYFKQLMTEGKVKTEEEEEKGEEKDLFEVDVDDVDEIDFAGEVKKNTELNKKMKYKEGDDEEEMSDVEAEDEGEGEGSEDGEDGDLPFNYDDMDNDEESDEEEMMSKKKTNFSDQDYEKALFEQLDSDGESLDGGDDAQDTNDNAGGGDSMFADAADFSHLLDREEEEESGKVNGVHRKQLQWEDKQNSKGWKARKANFHSKPRGNRHSSDGNRRSSDGNSRPGGGGNMKRKMNSNQGKFAKRKRK